MTRQKSTALKKVEKNEGIARFAIKIYLCSHIYMKKAAQHDRTGSPKIPATNE